MGKLYNRAQMTVSGTPGTGTITLNAAPSGYQSFAAAGVQDQDVVSYVVTDGTAWEIGEGAYTSSGTTLARGLIASSTGSLISLTSAALVFIDAKAQDLNFAAVRHTVVSGPISSGLPNFLSATYASLTVTTANVAAATPLVVTAARGWNYLGASDVTGIATSNLSWTATANVTTWLPVAVSSAGVVTAATAVTLQPIYQYGGSVSVTSGQYTFDINAMQMYLGNGSVANPVNHVIVGEVVAGASTVTATYAYAYNGRYDSGWTNTMPAGGTAVNKNANIGSLDAHIVMLAKCLTAEIGYSVGDVVTTVNGYYHRITYWQTGYTNVGFNMAGSYTIMNKSSGADATVTAANWAYKLLVRRSW